MSLNLVPKFGHRKPKRILKEKIIKKIFKRESVNLNVYGVNKRRYLDYASFGDERPYNCGKISCPAERRIREIRYKEEIELYEEILEHMNSIESKYGPLSEDRIEEIRMMQEQDSIHQEIQEILTQKRRLTKRERKMFALNTPLNKFILQDAELNLKEKVDPLVYEAGLQKLVAKYGH